MTRRPMYPEDFPGEEEAVYANNDAPTRTARKVTGEATPLERLDLNEELAIQLAEAKNHRDWVIVNTETMNPKDVSDAIKTVNTLITQIMKLQEALHNIENMKIYEEAIIECMKKLDEDTREAFLADLRARLEQ